MEPKTENVDFPLVLQASSALRNGEKAEDQGRNNGRNNFGPTAPWPPVEAFLLVFLLFSIIIIIFEPLLEPLQLTAVRE